MYIYCRLDTEEPLSVSVDIQDTAYWRTYYPVDDGVSFRHDIL